MTFTIICNKCDEKIEFEQGDNKVSDTIEIGVTEDCDIMGCTVESIDIYCSNCENEVNF